MCGHRHTGRALEKLQGTDHEIKSVLPVTNTHTANTKYNSKKKEKEAEASVLADMYISQHLALGLLWHHICLSPVLFPEGMSCTYIIFPRELDDFNAIMNNWRLAVGKLCCHGVWCFSFSSFFFSFVAFSNLAWYLFTVGLLNTPYCTYLFLKSPRIERVWWPQDDVAS